MKKKLLMLSLLCSLVRANNFTGHTYLAIRPAFTSDFPEKVSFFRNPIKKFGDNLNYAFQVVPLGGQTTNAGDLAEYFSFCNKRCLKVAADGAQDFSVDPRARDVNSFHFNIVGGDNNFESCVCFKPRQSFAGAGFEYQQYLGCDSIWWFDISAPILWVKNDMNLCETVSQELGGDVPSTSAKNMTEAFSGQKPFVNTVDGEQVAADVWHFGKICGPQSKTRLGDIEVKVGYDWANCDEYYVRSYVGMVAPTSNKPNAEFMFEPVAGNGAHWGVMSGGYAGVKLWECNDEHVVWANFAANGRYLFKNTQKRSFDIKGKPWSRYMAVFASAEDAANNILSSGINLFTRAVEVTPRTQFNLNAALTYDRCNWAGELGYNIYAKQVEKVKIKDCSDKCNIIAFEAPAFPDVDGSFTSANVINRAVTIGEDFELCQMPYKEALALTCCDLDIMSGTSPCALTNILYATGGYDWNMCNCYPALLAVGGSYEFAPENSAVNRWMVWGKWTVAW
ncbi:MAG: hypothetical protein WD055_05335 [Candidatus Dependentiae bacterium]